MNVLDTLDRTIFEKVRLGIVEQGRLPDWRALTGADLAAKRVEYRDAKNLIAQQVVEVFGHGVAKSRAAKLNAGVVIDRVSTSWGDLGGFGVKVFEDAGGGNFSQKQLPYRSLDISYQIRYFAENVFDLNLIEMVLFKMFNVSPNIFVLEENSWQFSTTQSYFAQVGNTIDLTTPDYMEKIYQILVKDVWICEDEVLGTYVPLTTITYDIYNKFDDTEKIAGTIEIKD